MTWNPHGTHAQEGDVIELVGVRHNHFLLTLKSGAELQSHRGVIKHDDLIGKPFGSQIISHTGQTFYLLQPALHDLLLDTPRNTQIMYPKDIGLILVTMGIGSGSVVLEAGSGSGALTRALAYAVGTEGKVFSYEVRPEMQQLAERNLKRMGLEGRVDFKLRDIAEGFDETNVDALFLDVPNPWDYMGRVREALKLGGFFGSILPTANQVSLLLHALRQYEFAFTEVVEVLLRYYRTEPERLRPNDRMIAHTGYLIFSRPIFIDHTRAEPSELEELLPPGEEEE